MRPVSPLLFILLAYLLVAASFAYFTPAWEAPDEPAHYNYIRQLAAGHLPVIEPGDYDQSYLSEVVFQSHFAPEYSLVPLQYEDWQPPLYYLILTPVFWATSGSLLALRLFSLLLGAGVIALSYQVASQLFPDHRWIAMTTAVFVAFLPQHVSVLASVNNDSLAELLIAAILLRLVVWDTKHSDHSPASNTSRDNLALGVLLGLGFLTKATVYPMALVTAMVIWRGSGKAWRKTGHAGLTVFLPAIALGALWWVRNFIVYDGLDLLGKFAHDRVVVGQPRTAELVEALGIGGALSKFIRTTFNSFWGQFGWMTLPMPVWVYRLLWTFTALVFIGLIIALLTRHSARWKTLSVKREGQLIILLALFLLTVAVHAGYNLTFEQHQGRYLFPALIPIGIGVTIGLGTWLTPLTRRWPGFSNLLPIVLAAALIGLDYWALFRIIVPNLG